MEYLKEGSFLEELDELNIAVCVRETLTDSIAYMVLKRCGMDDAELAEESGRFFDRSAYFRMMEDVESGKTAVCIMKDLTRWGANISKWETRWRFSDGTTCAFSPSTTG